VHILFLGLVVTSNIGVEVDEHVIIGSRRKSSFINTTIENKLTIFPED
jgi:hypothetical protein